MKSPRDQHPELPLEPDAPPPHLRPGLHLWVLLGGALGTAVRYALAEHWPTHTGRWPSGTFAVNLAGSLVLGVLLEGLARAGDDAGWRLRARLLVGTGFCGGLTTYSTFAVEADLLVRSHDAGLALAYVVVSVIAGLAAAALGIWLAGLRAGAR